MVIRVSSEESGLYYLQSRYYNPQWGRFLNADGYVSTEQGLLSCNMFAYCENNPVMYVDYDGNKAITFALCASLLDSEKDAWCSFEMYVGYVKYDVQLYKQGFLSLCWAFCEVMVDSYHSGTKLSQSKARKRAIEIAKRYHNSNRKRDWNNGGGLLTRGNEYILRVLLIYIIYWF